MTVREFAERVKHAWGLSAVSVYGDDSASLSRAALCGGAGGDLIDTAWEMGADVFITADVNYHQLLYSQIMKTHLMVANHGEMENASLPGLCGLVREATSLEAVLLEKDNWTPITI
jgi:putative NIF3 family GTP cyclohydrolase 1 type 2